MTALPNNENLAPFVEVVYMCDGKHVSTIKFHAQVRDYPKSWNCVTCHKKARYIASASTPTDEYVPDPKKLSAEMKSDDDTFNDPSEKTISDEGRYTYSHLQALRERRTQEELEALLNARLEALRAGCL